MDTAPETGAHGTEVLGRPSAAIGVLGDEHLARRIAAGDRAAFSLVYERHLPALVRYCQSIVLNPEDAEDAAQSAMMAALRALPGRPPMLKLRAWLFRVAHNEAISVIRRRGQERPLEDAEDVALADVADTAAARARWRELVTDLEALPERQRAALLMRELSGLGYDEVGGALGCTPATAMQTVFEARTALVHAAEGRSLSCTGIQTMLSAGDRRSLHARRVRAHMRSCDQCRTFAVSMKSRRRDFALFFPLASGKGALASILGMLGGGGGARRARVAEYAVRIQSSTGGSRCAVAGVVVALGGVTFAGHAHHAPHRAPAKPTAIVSGAEPRHVPAAVPGVITASARARRFSAREQSSARRLRPQLAAHSGIDRRTGSAPTSSGTTSPPGSSAGLPGAPPAESTSAAGAGGGASATSTGIQIGADANGVHASVGAAASVSVAAGSTGAHITATAGPASAQLSASTPSLPSVAGVVQHALPTQCLALCG